MKNKDDPIWFGMDPDSSVGTCSTAGSGSNLTLESLEEAKRAINELTKKADATVVAFFEEHNAHPDTHVVVMNPRNTWSMPANSYQDSFQYSHHLPIDKVYILPKPERVIH